MKLHRFWMCLQLTLAMCLTITSRAEKHIAVFVNLQKPLHSDGFFASIEQMLLPNRDIKLCISSGDDTGASFVLDGKYTLTGERPIHLSNLRPGAVCTATDLRRSMELLVADFRELHGKGYISVAMKFKSRLRHSVRVHLRGNLNPEVCAESAGSEAVDRISITQRTGHRKTQSVSGPDASDIELICYQIEALHEVLSNSGATNSDMSLIVDSMCHFETSIHTVVQRTTSRELQPAGDLNVHISNISRLISDIALFVSSTGAGKGKVDFEFTSPNRAHIIKLIYSLDL